MRDYEQLFSENLRCHLKEHIKGSVYTKVNNDTLVVKIKCDEIHFETSIDSFAYRLIYGMSCQDVTEEIVGRYRGYVRNCIKKRFFY